MSPQLHGGRTSLDPYLRRSERVTVLLRPHELDDIRTLSEAWGVSLSAAAWALLSERLSELRGEASSLGEVGVDVRAASRRILES